MGSREGGLLFRAGPAAFVDIKRRGFANERIGTIAGASGGAKWLVLSQLDRVLAETVLPALAGPVHLIGSSIGAWRFACYAQNEPVQAIARFEEAYLSQTYSAKPDVAEITDKTVAILDEVLGNGAPAQILRHPNLRLHIMTVRCRALLASDNRWLLSGGMALAAAANLVSRRSLGAFFARGLFFDRRDLPPFYNAPGFPLHRIPLTHENLSQAVQASGAIPLVLSGVRNISGAPPGTYRDGGIIDYHLDLPLSDPDRLTLFPHFFSELKPGWFDKWLPYRRLGMDALDRTIVVCPSPEFIARLPHAKVPDRYDFANFEPSVRERNWRQAVAACRELADELLDVLEHDKLAARLLPL